MARDSIAKLLVSSTVGIVLVVSAALYSGTLGVFAHLQLEHLAAFALVMVAAPNLALLFIGNPGRRYLPTLNQTHSYDIIVDTSSASRADLVQLVRNLGDFTNPVRVVFVQAGSKSTLLHAHQRCRNSFDGYEVAFTSSFAHARQLCTSDVTAVIRAANIRFAKDSVFRALSAFRDPQVACVEGGQMAIYGEATLWTRLAELYGRLYRLESSVLPAMVGAALPMETVTFYRTWVLRQLPDDAAMPWPQDHPTVQQTLLHPDGSYRLAHRQLNVTVVGQTPELKTLVAAASTLRKQRTMQLPLVRLWKFDVPNAAAIWLSSLVVRNVVAFMAVVGGVLSFVMGIVPLHIMATAGMLFYLNRLWVLSTSMVSQSDTVLRWLFAFICLPVFEVCIFFYVPNRDEMLHDDGKAVDRMRRPTA